MEFSNEQLVELYNSTRNEKYFNQLYNQNEGLIKSIIYKYNQRNMIDFSYEDIASQANIGFLKAVMGFDVSRNVKFSTLATIAMKREIHRVNIDSGRQKRYCMFEMVPIHSKPVKEKSYTFEETLSYDTNIFDSVDSLEFDSEVKDTISYKKLCKILSPEQLSVLNMLLEGKTQREIAKATNKTHQNVSLRVKMIREKASAMGLKW